MNNAEGYFSPMEYEICKRRGHKASRYTLATVPPKNICEWCGVTYWYSPPELHETGVPEDVIVNKGSEA